jgi:excisionase family DNA binding protein
MSQEAAMRTAKHTFAPPTEKDAATAREFLQELTSLLGSEKDLSAITLKKAGTRILGRKVGIPEALIRSLLDAAKLVAEGHPFAVLAADDEVSAQEAADFLRVSRPYVLNLLKKGVLPYRMVGSHHRIPVSALIVYKQDQAPRRRSLEALTAETQELGR